MLTSSLATKLDPHFVLIDRTARRFGVVPRQLLPHGLDGTSVRGEVWRKSDIGLDERLICADQKSFYPLVRGYIGIDICCIDSSITAPSSPLVSHDLVSQS